MANLKPVTLITGASAGIGAKLAVTFAAHGHDLVLVARRAAALTELGQAIAKEWRIKPQIVTADLTRGDAPAHIANELRVRGLEPDFVVNNAGFGLFGPAMALDRAEQLAMIDLNVRALTDLSLRFIDGLTRHRGGILNVASVASFMPGPGMAVYYATKAYVLSFSEALHHELKPRGVRVTALCPGPVATEFQNRANMPAEHFSSGLDRPADRVADAGYKGLMAGRRVVVPGKPVHLISMLPRFAPRGFVLAAMGRLLKRKP